MPAKKLAANTTSYGDEHRRYRTAIDYQVPGTYVRTYCFVAHSDIVTSV